MGFCFKSLSFGYISNICVTLFLLQTMGWQNYWLTDLFTPRYTLTSNIYFKSVCLHITQKSLGQANILFRVFFPFSWHQLFHWHGENLKMGAILKGPYADHILIPQGSTGSSMCTFCVKWKSIFYSWPQNDSF